MRCRDMPVCADAPSLRGGDAGCCRGLPAYPLEHGADRRREGTGLLETNGATRSLRMVAPALRRHQRGELRIHPGPAVVHPRCLGSNTFVSRYSVA